MKHTYDLVKTDGVCDIDQILAVLRSVSGVTSASLLEGKPRVAIVSDAPVSPEELNTALATHVPCRLENERVEAE